MNMRSNIDLVNECDSFPYPEREPEAYAKLISKFWEFRLDDSPTLFGYIPESVVLAMPWLQSSPHWIVDPKARVVTLNPDLDIMMSFTDAIAQTLDIARRQKSFEVLGGWRDELYAIYGHESGAPISMERAASPLFGINTYGVHMTVYVQTREGMKIWVPRRSRTKQTYGGMLDNTVAGGLPAGEKPFDALVREAAEEASLPEKLVRENAKQCGTVSYFYIRDDRAGGETDLLQPECQHVYDMEVGSDVVPKPNDDEVETFYLMTIADVILALGRGKFKPNCALVLLDFFIRHGILTPENEPDYIEIVSRIHRRLPFPTS